MKAKFTNETVVNEYFKNIEDCLKKYDLLDKPHLVFIIWTHRVYQLIIGPPSVVAGSNQCPPAVTSEKGKMLPYFDVVVQAMHLYHLILCSY